MDVILGRVVPPEATTPTTFRNGDTGGFNSSRGIDEHSVPVHFIEVGDIQDFCHLPHHEIEHSAETDDSRSLCARIGRVLFPPASEVATGFPQSQ